MLTALLVLFVLMGSFAGYWSATMYKFFNGKMWKRSTLATALLFPAMIFTIFWSLDLMVGSVPARHFVFSLGEQVSGHHARRSISTVLHVCFFQTGTHRRS